VEPQHLVVDLLVAPHDRLEGIVGDDPLAGFRTSRRAVV
jgi:hypothetical protein